MENNQIKKNIRQEEPLNIRDLIFKFVVYWPWFVISAIVLVVCAYIYLRFQEPVYSITSTILVKEQDQRTKMMGTAGGAMSALQDMGGFTMSSSFDNELEILKSRTLVKKVVSELGLYINTYRKGSFGYNATLYKNSPVNVYLTPQEAEKLQSPIRVDMRYTEEGLLEAKATYFELEEEKTVTQKFAKLPAVLPTPVGVLSFTPADSAIAVKGEVNLISIITTPKVTANSYSASLSIAASSKTTTIAKVTLKNTNRQRGADFINALVRQYNEDANNEKNEVARKTAEFIEDRISIINAELGSTESELAAFKQRSGLTDIASDAQLAKEQSTRYDQERIQNATQISLVRFLQSYINNPANRNEVIPANVGLQDENLSSVIDQYNTMIIERKRLLNTSSESNPAVINLNSGIDAMRNSVQTSVQSVLKGLEIKKSDIDRQAKRYETRISDAPAQEKEFMTISRQQEIKASLYIMLLQKREENAITLAATANNGRIIEAPEGSIAPVAPKKPTMMLAALIIGLLIPAAIIYIRELLKFKIETPEDVERITDVSIVAEIPMSNDMSEGGIVIHENHNNVMEEMFRGLRTNLQFMMEPKDKVIMVSSSMPGEGKSFIAGNIAVSMAFLGKKVLIVGLDIRKPGLNKVFRLTRRAEGITNYLSNPSEVNLFNLIQHSEMSPNLDILPGGPVPPNPTELVARETLDNAMAMLRERYDYIILDTAPIGMITDSAIISRVADICLYVCRADYTPKTSFQFINTLNSEKKIPKIATVINGIDMSMRKHSYYYGYGKKYGYGKRYNYGYGYNYGTDEAKK